MWIRRVQATSLSLALALAVSVGGIYSTHPATAPEAATGLVDSSPDAHVGLCLTVEEASMRVAQGARLCCCNEPATTRVCCKYVSTPNCPARVPGCGC